MKITFDSLPEAVEHYCKLAALNMVFRTKTPETIALGKLISFTKMLAETQPESLDLDKYPHALELLHSVIDGAAVGHKFFKLAMKNNPEIHKKILSGKPLN